MTINQSSNSSSILLGGAGAKIVSDTTANIGPFYCIKAITACVVDTIIFSPSVEGSLNGFTILAGDSIMLYVMESVKLTSGSAILYRVIPT